MHVGSCSLDSDERCMSGGHVCPAGLICVGDQCANACTTDADCPPDAICRDAMTTGTRFCFAPDRQDGGPPGIDSATPDASGQLDVGTDASSDGGIDALVPDTGPDAGMDVGTDAGNDAALDTGPPDAARPDGGGCFGAACGTVADLCATAEGACVLRGDGHVLCWGEALILGDTYDAAHPPHHTCSAATPDACSVSPVTVRLSTGLPLMAREIACAAHTVCAITDANAVVCWGDNAFGQLGAPGPDALAPVVVSLGGGPLAQHLVAGEANFCADLGTGTPRCWGDSTSGALGIASAMALPRSLSLATGTTLGRGHSCVYNGGTADCRGDNAQGQLGPMGAGMASSIATIPVMPGGGINQIRASATSTCVLIGSGDAYCWGTGACGELGIGSAAQSTPTHVGTATYRAMWASAFSGRVCAERTSASEMVDCWGNFPSPTSCNAVDATSTPVHVAELDHTIRVALGRRHWCFVDTTGGVQCAGNNALGQVARDPAADVDSSSFVPVCVGASCVP